MAPATAHLDVDYLASAAIHQALTLGDSLRELRAREYATQTPLILLDLLEGIVDDVRDQLLELTAGRPLEAARRMELRGLGQALDQVTELSEYVVRCADADVPWGLVYPLELFCRQLTPESRMIIYPAWRHGYTYGELMGTLYRIMRSVRELPEGEFLPGYPRFLAVFSFPPIQGPNILQNAAWGHEIGHHLDTVFNVSAEVLKAPAFVERAGGVLTAAQVEAPRAARAPQGQFDPNYERVSHLTPIVKILGGWVAELVADIFSVHVFGPASLFAFSEIPSALAWSEPSWSHPPSWLRIAAMLDELRYLGYDALLDAAQSTAHRAAMCAAVGERLATLAQVAARGAVEPATGRFFASITGVFAGARGEMASHVRGVVRDWACRAERIAGDVFELVERLDNVIPPCEVDLPGELVGRATTLAAIVNAGWFYRIWRSLDRAPRDGTEARELHAELARLNELVLKAIELSAAKRQLTEVGGGVDDAL